MDNRWRRVFAIALVLLVSTAVRAEDEIEGTPNPTSKPSPLFTPGAYIEHVRYLASDELGGRGTGSEGIDLAAEYIVEQFKAAGCEPAGMDGTWFQPFDIALGKELTEDEAQLEIDGLEQDWKIGQDWTPFPFSAPESVEGPLAFAGYGIEAERFDYNDYEDFDADGKILLIFRYEPKDEDPNAPLGGETYSRHSEFRRKARAAAKHGATALLVVNPLNRDPDHGELYDFDSYGGQETYALPMAHITRAAAEAILKHAGMPDLTVFQEELDEGWEALSCDLGLTVKLHPGVKPKMALARNVLGLIRGTGDTDETIVVGAHYDHLGTKPPRGAGAEERIFNGADDNASGTAGVIELARALKQAPTPCRNILLMTFSGEEMGLLGSRHFVENPTIEIDDVQAMVNLDMIGRLNRNKFSIIGATSAAEFPELIKAAADKLGLEYRASGGFGGGSDHAPFIRRDIPAMFLFTGIHKEYHRQADDWELIDAEGATRVLQLAYELVTELANMEEGPAFTKATTQPSEDEQVKKPAAEEQREAAKRADADADEPADTDQPPSRTNLRVRLGIVPDMVGDDQPGMIVDSVVDGGPAKAAGIHDGDRILEIGGEGLRDIYGYIRILQDYKPGDELEVIVLRNGEKKTLKVKLQASTRRRPGD